MAHEDLLVLENFIRNLLSKLSKLRNLIKKSPMMTNRKMKLLDQVIIIMHRDFHLLRNNLKNKSISTLEVQRIDLKSLFFRVMTLLKELQNKWVQGLII